MNLNELNDNLLVEKTGELIHEERRLLTSILHHFREINRRRLFSELGFKSLYDMVVRHFGYSEQQAYRRIAAMRLLEELPEIEEKISGGELSLTHLSLAQTLFRQEKLAQAEIPRKKKIQILQKVAGKSTREAENIVLSFSTSPKELKPDRMNAVTEKHSELRFIASNQVLEKVARLKGLLAHRQPNVSLGELFEQLCDLALVEWDPAKISAPVKRRVTNPASLAHARRTAFLRAKNRCQSCGSVHALEIDHILPRGKGGGDDPENLRVLCRSCNQRAAIREFGQKKMDSFINR